MLPPNEFKIVNAKRASTIAEVWNMPKYIIIPKDAVWTSFWDSVFGRFLAALVSIALVSQFFEHENHSTMLCLHCQVYLYSNCYYWVNIFWKNWAVLRFCCTLFLHTQTKNFGWNDTRWEFLGQNWWEYFGWNHWVVYTRQGQMLFYRSVYRLT